MYELTTASHTIRVQSALFDFRIINAMDKYYFISILTAAYELWSLNWCMVELGKTSTIFWEMDHSVTTGRYFDL